MPSAWIVAGLVAIALIPDSIGSHLARRAAQKVVSRAVQEGIEDAFREAALDSALDAVTYDAVAEVTSSAQEIDDYVAIGAQAMDGVESAMQAADLAARLDDVADAAKAIKRVGKIRKLKR